jgi:hypothetical protein
MPCNVITECMLSMFYHIRAASTTILASSYVCATCYYLCAFTAKQLSYPKNKSIKWKYVLSLLLRLILCCVLQTIILQQYIMPALQSSFHPVTAGDLITTLETLLALSIPSTYIWYVKTLCIILYACTVRPCVCHVTKALSVTKCSYSDSCRVMPEYAVLCECIAQS